MLVKMMIIHYYCMHTSHNKALHLTTRASAICESCSAIWGHTVVRGWSIYHSGVAGELSRYLSLT